MTAHHSPVGERDAAAMQHALDCVNAALDYVASTTWADVIRMTRALEIAEWEIMGAIEAIEGDERHGHAGTGGEQTH